MACHDPFVTHERELTEPVDLCTPEGDRLDPAALGYPVTAFLTLQLRQGAGHDVVARHLRGIAEVTEAHTITGEGDMWCRVVARSNADLQRVIDAVLAHEGFTPALIPLGDGLLVAVRS